MRLAGAARLFLLNAVWRSAGARWAGRALLESLGEKDRDLAAIAGIFLAKSGERAEPLLLEALSSKENLGTVLPLLGDVGRLEHSAELERLRADPDPRIARAAKEALDVMLARHAAGPTSSAHG